MTCRTAELWPRTSWRGLQFITESYSTSAGRRYVHHEFPKRERHLSEDLGGHDREYDLQCFVALDPGEYEVFEGDLLAACERPGVSELLHPTLGSLSVVLRERARISGKLTELRLLRFELRFRDAQAEDFGAADFDLGSQLDGAIGELDLGIADHFSAALDFEGVSSWAQDIGAGAIEAVGGAIEGVRLDFAGLADLGSTLSLEMGQLVDQAASLVSAPLDLAGRVLDGVQGLADIVTAPVDRLAAMTGLRLLPNAWDVPFGGTPSAIVARGAQSAIFNGMRWGALGRAAQAATAIRFPTRGAMEASRAGLLDWFDAELGAASAGRADRAFGALRRARGLAGDLMRAGAEGLGDPVIERVDGVFGSPLVLAYDRLGAPARATEIAAANGAFFPGISLAGRSIEIPSR